MKALALILCLFAVASASAEVAQPPTVAISAKTLGGTVLMIQMKYSLVLQGDENAKILRELGEVAKKNFYRDIVLSKSVRELRKSYGRKNRPVTNATITKYETLLATPKTVTLN